MTADRSLHEEPNDGLFDVDRIVHTCRDVRSVGEMLHDADHLARGLLMDVDGEDAASLLRTWPSVVDAGASVWDAIPRVHSDEQVTAMKRLVATAGIFRSPLDREEGWPGRGPGHAGALQIAATLRSAGSLIARFGGEPRPEKPEVRRDIDATRARVMHTLYLTAHASTVALNAYGRDLVQDSYAEGRKPIPLSTVHTAYAVRPTIAWLQRAARCENIARDYLSGDFAASVQGEALSPLGDTSRVPRALARWDIQAHRTLAATPTPANIVVTARTQAWITAASGVLLQAVRPANTDPDRLETAIAVAGETWSDLAGRWHDLAQPSDQIDPALHRAAAELRAAYRELTHETAVLASPETIASRAGLDRAVTASLDALTAADELAYTVEDQAHAAGLTGPARPLSQRAHNDVEAGLFALDPGTDTVWISPADIQAKRVVPLPPPVAHGLRTASNATLYAAGEASTAAAIKRPPELPTPQERAPNPLRTAEWSSEVRPSGTQIHGACPGSPDT